MNTPLGFGVRVEARIISLLDGRSVRRLPIQWSKPSGIGLEIKIMGIDLQKLHVDQAVYNDLPLTLLVEPTHDEIAFRVKTGAILAPTSDRHILLVCSNPKCTFKRVVKIFYNDRFGVWQITECGNLESRCPKCQDILYSCGKSVIAPKASYEGYSRCQCVSHFNSLGQIVSIPESE